MTEVEAAVAPPKEEDDKDEDESVYSDPNGIYIAISDHFATIIFDIHF